MSTTGYILSTIRYSNVRTILSTTGSRNVRTILSTIGSSNVRKILSMLKGVAIPDPLLLLSRSLDVKQQSFDLATTLGRTCIMITSIK
jgi:hypothetical protein